jgi:hypothetical protein
VSRVLSVLLLLTVCAAGSDADARKRGRKGKKRKPAPAAVTPAPAAEETPETPEPAGAVEPAKAAAPEGKGGKKAAKGPKVMDFTGLAVEGKLRTPQLLYFLGRAKEELERASLEDRSFMPELVRSIDEGDM